MPTLHPPVHTTSDLQNDALTMAIALLTDRIRNLPKDDKADFFELAMELPNVTSEEEFQSIQVAMREILVQKPIRVRRMDLSRTEAGPGLQKWKDYASERIRTLRTQAGLTQGELAAKSGLPQSHISRLENGVHSPNRMTLEKIASALEQPISVFDPSA